MNTDYMKNKEIPSVLMRVHPWLKLVKRLTDQKPGCARRLVKENCVLLRNAYAA